MGTITSLAAARGLNVEREKLRRRAAAALTPAMLLKEAQSWRNTELVQATKTLRQLKHLVTKIVIAFRAVHKLECGLYEVRGPFEADPIALSMMFETPELHPRNVFESADKLIDDIARNIIENTVLRGEMAAQEMEAAALIERRERWLKEQNG